MPRLFTLTTSLALIMLLGFGCSTVPNNTIPVGQTMPTAFVPPEEETPVAAETDISTTLTRTQTSTAPAMVKNAPLAPTGKIAPRSYTDDLKIYRSKGAYMLLLSCHGQPGVMSIKRGVRFMIDNQDTKAHTVAIDKASVYRLGARGYVVATAPPSAGQYNLTCDGGGAAQINVES